MTLGYLHISDLHLSHGPNQRPVDAFNQDVVTNAMIKTIEDLVTQGAVIDFIIITGDLARYGKTEEYEVAEIFCEKLLKATGLPADRLFIVPGNHDVDRADVKPIHIKKYYPFDTQDEVTEILTDPDTFTILMRKFFHFHEFAQKAMDRCVYDGNKCCFVTTLDIKKNDRIFRINLTGLNSALFAGYDGDDQQKLALSLLQVNQALENTDKTAFLTMAFFHHPFACFHPEDKVAKNRLMREVDLILTGHLHEPSNAFIRDAAGKAVVIGAGASYMTRESRNSFNIVQINPDTCRGRAQFYKYLHDHDRWKKDTDVNPDTDDGHFPFEIGTSAGSKGTSAEKKGELGSGPAQVNTAEVCGPGAVAQGNSAAAAGPGGIAVGGDVTGNII